MPVETTKLFRKNAYVSFKKISNSAKSGPIRASNLIKFVNFATLENTF